MCCSYGSDLMAALQRLPSRVPPPEHVLIEASGVALPGAVARAVKLLPDYAIDGVVVVADAETVRARAADRYMGDTIARQLADADLIVLNKTDLVAAAVLDQARAWLASVAAQARVISALRARLPPEVLLGVQAERIYQSPERTTAGVLRPLPAHDAAALYESASFSPDGALDLEYLAQELAQPGPGLLRAKGVLRDRDGSGKTLQLVGARWEIAACKSTHQTPNRLVCIGVRGRLDKGAIAATIARAQCLIASPGSQ